MGVFFLILKTPPIRNDAREYHSKGIEIADKGLGVIINEPQKREPIYPIFVGICFKVFGKNDNAVRVVQVILSGFTCLLVYSLASRYYGDNIGFLSAMLYSLCPTFAHYPGFFLTETLAVFLFLLSYRLVIKAKDSGSIPIAIIAGLSLSVAALTKYVFLFFGLFIVFLPIIFRKEMIKWNIRSAGIAVIMVMLPVVFFSIWGYWNVLKIDPEIKQDKRIGRLLIYNGSELALNPREKAARIIGLMSRNLSEKIFPEIDYKILWPHPEVYKKLLKAADEKYPEISSKDDRYVRFALDLYKEYPLGYLVSRITTLMRLNAFQYPSRLNETDRWKDFYNRSDNNSLIIIVLDILLKIVSNPFFWAIGGFLVMIKQKRPAFPIMLPALYINLVYCFIDGIPRFGLPALPFYLIAGSVMFSYLLNKIDSRFVSIFGIKRKS